MSNNNAQIVIAAGSVIKDPNSGPIVNIDNHHAAGVLFPNTATLLRADSAKDITGLEAAIAIITTTKIGSV